MVVIGGIIYLLINHKLFRVSNSTIITGPDATMGLGEPVGTLYFTGEIIEGATGAEAITLYWKADVTAVEGMKYIIGLIWFDVFSAGDPDSTLVAFIGPGDIGVHHVYERTMTFISNNVHLYDVWDGVVVQDHWAGPELGFDSPIWKQNFRTDIFSRFMHTDSDTYPLPQPEYWDTNIETPHFKFVRRGSNFWFE